MEIEAGIVKQAKELPENLLIETDLPQAGL
jgi:hypothetical protein